ncbi:hypothetical protein BC332_03452 [Capsicum chinense]|nr:hypothetical protein BC332_03452 [Capsicum chinense]
MTPHGAVEFWNKEKTEKFLVNGQYGEVPGTMSSSHQQRSKGKNTARPSEPRQKKSREDDRVPAAPHVPRGQKRFGTKVVVAAERKWYSQHKGSKYSVYQFINRASLMKEYLFMVRKIEAQHMSLLFKQSGVCNLSLVQEFYANWNPKDSEVEVCDHVITFTANTFNELLGAPYVDPDPLKTMITELPHQYIRHLLCGTRSTIRWIQYKERGLHSRTLLRIGLDFDELGYDDIPTNEERRMAYSDDELKKEEQSDDGDSGDDLVMADNDTLMASEKSDDLSELLSGFHHFFQLNLILCLRLTAILIAYRKADDLSVKSSAILPSLLAQNSTLLLPLLMADDDTLMAYEGSDDLLKLSSDELSGAIDEPSGVIDEPSGIIDEPSDAIVEPSDATDELSDAINELSEATDEISNAISIAQIRHLM